jgi:hypothetical protein
MARTVQCAQCSLSVPDDTVEGATRTPCPQCGSTARIIADGVREAGEALDGYGLKHFRRSARKKKSIFESKIGIYPRDDPNRPGLVYIKMTMDYFANWYSKLVIDHETGAIEKQQAHRLTEHRNHGSAKPGLVPRQKRGSPKGRA